jgi:hypothetical protein
MVKVSITLPNNAQITFESEEPEVIQQVVGMVLRDLPRDLMRSAPEVNNLEVNEANGVNGSAEHPPASEKGNGVVNGSADARKAPSAQKDPPVKESLNAAERAFVEFCQSASPLGDMRRVVVAAEGARRFLDIDSVEAEELGRLFDLAGWQHPHSFVQTLRNAARSKFRWLERVPGRSGYYTVTDIGRATALDN